MNVTIITPKGRITLVSVKVLPDGTIEGVVMSGFADNHLPGEVKRWFIHPNATRRELAPDHQEITL